LTPGTSGNSALVLNTTLTALASGLNNVQASTNALYGSLQGATASNAWSGTGLLFDLAGDLRGIRTSTASDLDALGDLMPAVDSLSSSDARLFLDAVQSEVPTSLDAMAASLNALEGELPGSASNGASYASSSIGRQLSTTSSTLTTLAGNLNTSLGQVSGLGGQALTRATRQVGDLLEDAAGDLQPGPFGRGFPGGGDDRAGPFASFFPGLAHLFRSEDD
jgi:hypothetical protein